MTELSILIKEKEDFGEDLVFKYVWLFSMFFLGGGVLHLPGGFWKSERDTLLILFESPQGWPQQTQPT